MDPSQVIGSLITSVDDGLNQSAFFLSIKAFLFVYVVVLVIDIALLLYVHGLKGDLKKLFYGTKDRPFRSATALRKEWQRIERRLSTGNPSEYKVAILEADHLTDAALQEMEYSGGNLQERLETMSAMGLGKADEVKEMHAIRNRIIYEQDFSVDRAEAERILGVYKDFLEHWEIL